MDIRGDVGEAGRWGKAVKIDQGWSVPSAQDPGTAQGNRAMGFPDGGEKGPSLF